MGHYADQYEADDRIERAKRARFAIDRNEATRKSLKAAAASYQGLPGRREDVLLGLRNAIDLLELDISRAEKVLTENGGE